MSRHLRQVLAHRQKRTRSGRRRRCIGNGLARLTPQRSSSCVSASPTNCFSVSGRAVLLVSMRVSNRRQQSEAMLITDSVTYLQCVLRFRQQILFKGSDLVHNRLSGHAFVVGSERRWRIPEDDVIDGGLHTGKRDPVECGVLDCGIGWVSGSCWRVRRILLVERDQPIITLVPQTSEGFAAAPGIGV